MLSKHGAELDATESELKALDAQIASARQGAHRGRRAGDGRRATKLQGAGRPDLGDATQNPEYVEKRRAAENLAQVAAESLRKTEQAEADREAKGKPYRDDPLFMYLWERGFGTKNYRAQQPDPVSRRPRSPASSAFPRRGSISRR